MGLESGTYIDSLNILNPASGDLSSEGDDHIRLIKSTIKSTFPNVGGAVSSTHSELNYVDVTPGTLTAGKALVVDGSSTLNNIILTSADINGGTIDGVSLGASSAVSLGTPSSGTLTNCTGLPVSTGISGLGASVASFLATPSSANLATAVTGETGTGALVFGTSPTLASPVFNTGVSGTAILDEDNMSSDSATQLATQQSIKAYVDAINTTAIENNLKIIGLVGAKNGNGDFITTQNGYADAFTSEGNINTGASSNEVYDGTNDRYETEDVLTEIDYTGSANIGDMTGGGGLAAAFDGDLDQAGGSPDECAKKLSSVSAFVGKDWGSGNTKSVAGVKAWGSNNRGYSGQDQVMDFLLYGSNSAPSTPTDGTLIATLETDRASVDNADAVEYLSGITPAAFRYNWLTLVSASGTDEFYLAEVEFYEITSYIDLTLLSTAFTANAVPSTVDVIVLHDPIDSVTLNTDVKVFASRDNGATYTQGTLSNIASYSSDGAVVSLKASIDVSSQPSGTAIIWKITTHNSKGQHFYGVAISWS